MFLFSDGSDLNVGIRRPRDIKYIKHLRRAFLFIGVWPGKLLGEKERFRPLHHYGLLISLIMISIAEILYLINNLKVLSFFDLAQTYICLLISAVNVTRLSSIVLKKYDNIIKVFLEEIHLFNFKHQSDYAMKTHLFIHKLSHFFTMYSVTVCMMIPIMFSFPALYNNITSGQFKRSTVNVTYEQPVYYEMPFDYQHNFTGFLVIFIMNIFLTAMSPSMFCIMDLLLSVLIFHLWGHLKILIYNLESFPRPKSNVFEPKSSLNDPGSSEVMLSLHYTAEEQVEVARRLKDIVDQHRRILKHIKNVSEACGIDVAIYYAFHQICGCFLLLACSQLDLKSLIRFGPISILQHQLLMQISVIFDLLKKMNDPLERAVYNLPWECMDPKNRQLVLMMLRRVQRPLGLKAMGMVEVGCVTAATVLKTTLSYFVMLLTLADNK